MTESLDTSTAMGRFVMDIIQRIAQLESEQIGERVYDGMKQKAKMNAGNLGFNIPYGYDYDSGKLKINAKEQIYIKEIFKLYQSGKSMNQIANKFNQDLIPTKRNKRWGAQTISRILKNPIYCGKFHWDNYVHSGSHDAIISTELFNEVQELIKIKFEKNMY
jgi:DNA invertase Pin-like site-specific DNA recombinase